MVPFNPGPLMLIPPSRTLGSPNLAASGTHATPMPDVRLAKATTPSISPAHHIVTHAASPVGPLGSRHDNVVPTEGTGTAL